jgi:hypothetical protein
VKEAIYGWIAALLLLVPPLIIMVVLSLLVSLARWAIRGFQ